MADRVGLHDGTLVGDLDGAVDDGDGDRGAFVGVADAVGPAGKLTDPWESTTRMTVGPEVAGRATRCLGS